MERRLWPYAATALLAIALVAAAFFTGRGTASSGDGQASAPATAAASGAATKTIDGIPVGIQRSRAGALAAADNYVALGTESVVQNPDQYSRLVGEAWTPEFAPTALAEAKKTRAESASTTREYESGAKAWP